MAVSIDVHAWQGVKAEVRKLSQDNIIVVLHVSGVQINFYLDPESADAIEEAFWQAEKMFPCPPCPSAPGSATGNVDNELVGELPVRG